MSVDSFLQDYIQQIPLQNQNNFLKQSAVLGLDFLK
jgi:hypothetical protein